MCSITAVQVGGHWLGHRSKRLLNASCRKGRSSLQPQAPAGIFSESEMSCVDWSYRAGASSWNKLFDRYYRKTELYSMRWGSVDLSKMIVAAAQYAGPLGSYLRRFPCIKISDLSCRAAAVIRDEKKMSLVTAGSLRPTLNIYGCSGILLASIPVIISFCAVLSTLIRRALQWKSGRLIEMGWSEDEKLICVLDDGTIQIYSVQGRLLQTFSMGAEFREDRVLHCCIWGGGVVCLSRGFCLAYIDNLEEPTVRKMPRLTDLS